MIIWKKLTNSLHILQLEEYSLRRWWRWYRRQVFQPISVVRKPLVWTFKLQLACLSSIGLWLVSVVVAWWLWWWVAFVLLLSGILIPGLWVGVGGLVFIPIDQLVYQYRKLKIKQELMNVNITVVGIVGSFGKTSVKELLFSILDRAEPTLMTPENFNTLGGIHRVVREELSRQTYFIAELGAYGQGDIRKLAQAVHPQWAVLTGIGLQHLERFGSIEEIAQAKMEIIDQVHKGKVVVNWDSQPLRDHLIKNGLSDTVIKVGWKHGGGVYQVKKVRMQADGLSFQLTRERTSLMIASSLFGSVNVTNVALAASMAWEMGIALARIQQGLASVRAPRHRLELRTHNKAHLIDNTYSSNVTGFTQVMSDLQELKGKKALVTPGLIELGDETYIRHVELGQAAAAVFTEIMLVGRNTRTEALEEGVATTGFTGALSYIDPGLVSYWQTVERLTKKYDWVLLENDLPDQYY